jgi:hypothetical protein
MQKGREIFRRRFRTKDSELLVYPRVNDKVALNAFMQKFGKRIVRKKVTDQTCQ